MIEIHTIRVMQDIPGRIGYVGDVRLVDKSKGTHVSDIGMELLNWDKAFYVEAASLPELLGCMSNSLTEVLCDETL
jgi:hypothetical protein